MKPEAGPPERSLFGGLFGTLKQARLNRHEIAGSLGDMGTFLPLLVGMAAQNGLNFATALFFAGLFNIVTGLTFSIPMAVQPMKAIAAVAITEGLTVPQIVAAGAAVSAVVLVLGLTGLIDWLNRVVPKSVVRGLQLALGLSLLMKGLQMVAATQRLGCARQLAHRRLGCALWCCCSLRRAVSRPQSSSSARGSCSPWWPKPEVLGNSASG